MKRILLPAALLLCFASCSSDGPDGSDANDSTENALQRVGNNIEEGVKEAVDSGVPKLGRAVDRAGELLDRADTAIGKVGDKVERAGNRIEQRFKEGRDGRDTSR